MSKGDVSDRKGLKAKNLPVKIISDTHIVLVFDLANFLVD